MLEALAQVLAQPGLVPVLLAVGVAGLVYGFAGFGSALIFTPVAVAFIRPEIAIAAFSLSSLVSAVTVLPAATREADLRASGLMILAALITTPLGVYGLAVLPVETVRTIVACIVLVTLVALVLGWRMQTQATASARLAIGGASGVLGGMTGLNGPIVILFQLAGTDSVRRGRANLIVFLTLTSISFMPQLWLQGLLTPEALWLGVVLMPVYALSTWLGKRLFSPAREPFYRRIAYVIIGVAGLMALPFWG